MLEIKTLDRSKIGQTFRRQLVKDGKTLDLPRKSIQRGKIRDHDKLSNSVFGANEYYKEINTATLRKARNRKYSLHFEGLDRQVSKSKSGEFDFTILNYTDTHRIRKTEAYQIVGISGEASDFLISPIQSKLYHSIGEDSGLDDWAYQSIYTGTELFLQGCFDLHPDMPIMGWLPQLDLERLENLINLYEKYDVEAFLIDFNWELPTRWDKRARLRYLMRRIANQRIHEDVLIYGINMRPGTYNNELNYIPAANLEAVRMMVDIIGGNHTGPRIPPDEEIEPREGFRLFKPNWRGYRVYDIPELQNVWPNKSELDVDTVIENSMSTNRQRNRYETLVNSELIEHELQTLRWCLDEGMEDRYHELRVSSDDAVKAGKSVRKAFQDGIEAPVGEYT